MDHNIWILRIYNIAAEIRKTDIKSEFNNAINMKNVHREVDNLLWKTYNMRNIKNNF